MAAIAAYNIAGNFTAHSIVKVDVVSTAIRIIFNISPIFCACHNSNILPAAGADIGCTVNIDVTAIS